jgi:hypothetical protein
MATPWLRSQVYWFRQGVPKGLRPILKKTEPIDDVPQGGNVTSSPFYRPSDDACLAQTLEGKATLSIV